MFGWNIALLVVLLAAPAAIATTNRCTDAAGNLLPSAQSCSDDRNDCATVFKTVAGVTPASRDPLCDMPLLAEVAKKCSKTCALCCENPNYSCGDAKGYEKLCPTWKNTCASPVLQVREQMVRLCAGTCGLCMQSSCKDALPDCAKSAILCNDVTAGPVWKQQCARTCGSCPKTRSPVPSPNAAPAPAAANNCQDKGTSCPSNAHLCNDQRFKAFMTKQCPVTCGKCALAGAVACADSRNDCAYQKTIGFCTNAADYEIQFRRETCGITCGLCGAPIAAACADSRNDCAYQRTIGFCTNAADYEIEFRRETCGITCGLC